MKKIRLKNLIREEIRRVLREAKLPQLTAYVQAQVQAQVFKPDAKFVTIDNDVNVTEYDNFKLLTTTLDKDPRQLGFESAEDELTNSDIISAEGIFAKAKSQLDGTSDYKLIGRVSDVKKIDDELWIWCTV